MLRIDEANICGRITPADFRSFRSQDCHSLSAERWAVFAKGEKVVMSVITIGEDNSEAKLRQAPRAMTAVATVLAAGLTAFAVPTSASAQQPKPNILVIMADDIGYWNISAYNRGMMGYRTPNIDRIANEGALFTDYYGQQSCTAGRSAFITGQSPMRTGLLKVGLPGAKEGLSDKDPTLADLLKPQGYVTGQFGKNHLGDRNEFLPTVHGFDEFFGNLYHLNAEDEPEHPDYPKNTEFRLRFGPRGVLRCTATTTDTPGEDPRFGPWGKQNCEDTGALDKKRMETVDQEFLDATLNFIDRAKELGRGCQQVVIPGAGLDTRGVRKQATGVTYFEIDDADILNFKKERLAEAGIEAKIVYIPGNYVADDLLRLLRA